MRPRLFKTLEGLQAFLLTRHGHALHLLVLHDNACTPIRCVCSPWYEVRELTTDSWLDGAAREREWIRKVAS